MVQAPPMSKMGLGIFLLLFACGLYYRLQANTGNIHTQAAPGYDSTNLPPYISEKPLPTPLNVKIVGLSQGKVSSEDLNDDYLKNLKDTVTKEDLQFLAKSIVQGSLSSEERRRALYAITQMGPVALPALTLVVTSPFSMAQSQNPHSVEQYQQAFEVGLRVTAIEALDELSTTSEDVANEVRGSMNTILETQKNRTLTLLAQISLSGIESGRPGKVKRAVDTLLKERE